MSAFEDKMIDIMLSARRQGLTMKPMGPSEISERQQLEALITTESIDMPPALMAFQLETKLFLAYQEGGMITYLSWASDRWLEPAGRARRLLETVGCLPVLN